MKTLISKAFNAFIALIIATFPLFSQNPYGTSPSLFTESTYASKTINQNLAVGAVSGQAGVSNGAVSYHIPIYVPPGTNGVQPTVSVNYNSMGGQGIMGMGWSLAAASSITVGPKNYYYDGKVSPVSLDQDDAFYLDGKRLILKSNSNGATYGLEAEDWSIITSHGGSAGNPDWFQITKKDGVIYEYGHYSANSKLIHTSTNKTMAWYLSKIIYPDKNYIEYVYQYANNETLLDKIKYTNNLVINAGFFAEVDFTYGDRVDKGRSYIKGQAINSTKLLVSIETKTENSLAKKYVFDYGHDDLNSFLTEVTEYGSDGLKRLNSTIFKYGDKLPLNLRKKVVNDVLSNLSEGKRFVGDFNGDGRSDILHAKSQLQNGNRPRIYTGFDIYLENNGVFLNPSFSSGSLGDFSFYENNDSYAHYANANFHVLHVNEDNKSDIILFGCQYSGSTRSYKGAKVYKSSATSNSYSIQNIPPPPSFTGTDATTNGGDNQFYFVGDFDGDGYSDFIVITRGVVGTTQVEVEGANEDVNITGYRAFFTSIKKNIINKQIAFPSQYTGSHQELIHTLAHSHSHLTIDYNGDGAVDLMFVDGSNSYIFTFKADASNNVTAENLYTAGFPTQWHLIYAGDVNQDGKTDLLTRGSRTNNNIPWYMAINTGNGFQETLFHFDVKPDIVNYHRDKIIYGDYTGDGKVEIGHITDRSSYGTSHDNIYLYHYNGDTYKKSSILETDTEDSSIGFNMHAPGDFNGDGKIDFLYGYYAHPDIAYINKNDESRYLFKVKDGFLKEDKFYYSKMSSPEINQFYIKGDYASNGVSSIGSSTTLAKFHYFSNGKGGFNYNNYRYKGALYEKSGKGILGFQEITSYNNQSGLYTVQSQIVHNTASHKLMMPAASQIRANLNYSIPPLKVNTSNYSVIDKGNKRFFLRTNSSYSRDYKQNTFQSSDMSLYDNYGNIKSMREKAGYYDNNGNEVVLQNNLTTKNYIQKNTPVPAKVSEVKITNTTTGQATYSRTDRYLYTTKGQLYRHTAYAGLAKEVRTYYDYNPDGTIQQNRTYTSGEHSRTTKNYYDSKGRYIAKKYNQLNQKVLDQTVDPRWGTPLSTTGIDGLMRTYTYDEFGREITAKWNHKNYTYRTHYRWYPSSAYTYYIWKSSPGAPDTYTYKDQLGRTLRKRTTGLKNNWVYTDYTYDNLGRQLTETAPYKSGETKLTTTYVYDNNDVYRRLKSKSNSLGTTTFNYGYDTSKGLSIASTSNPANQTTTVKTDARGLMTEKSDNGGTLYYTYDSSGNEKEVSDGSKTLVTNLYDSYNRQTSMVDINGGTTSYVYDAYNRLRSQTNANGETSTYTYDNLDRPKTEVLPEGTTTYEYYPTGSGAKTNKLKKTTSFSGAIEEYDYDTQGRLSTEKKTVDGVLHTFTHSYDSYDRVSALQYPSGLKIRYRHDTNGYLLDIKDYYNSSNTIFEPLSANGYGQLKSYKLGNGKTSTITYHHGIPTRYTTPGVQDLEMNWNYSSGNLNYRRDYVKNKKENFTYDNLNRLKTSSGTGIPSINLNYAANGNISSKTAIGSYTYHGSKINAVSKVSENAVGGIPTTTQDITYSSYLQPEMITEGNKKLNYTYGSDLQRIKSVYQVNNTTQRTRYYMGDYEKVVDHTGTEHLHYISSGQGLVAIVSRKNNVNTFRYAYTDHLGSIVSMTNGSGTVIAEQNYDPWGRERNPTTWTYNSIPSKPKWLYRGYTGHEMVPAFQLINMNGRMYDPLVARMLSVDNYVHDGAGLQGYNRYSYALNNPLSYTDPDGEEPVTAILIGAAIGVVTNGISNTINDRPFFQGALQAALFGAVGGGVSSAIGVGASILGKTYGWSQVAVGSFQAASHALSGGYLSYVQSGDFWSGAAAGGISSISGSLIDISSLKGNYLKAAHWVGGGLSGGLGAMAVGGDFWAGVKQGLITGGLNHAAGQIQYQLTKSRLISAARKAGLCTKCTAQEIGAIFETIVASHLTKEGFIVSSGKPLHTIFGNTIPDFYIGLYGDKSGKMNLLGGMVEVKAKNSGSRLGLASQSGQIFKQLYAHAVAWGDGRGTHTIVTTGGVRVSPMIRAFASGIGIRSHHFSAMYSGRLTINNISFKRNY